MLLECGCMGQAIAQAIGTRACLRSSGVIERKEDVSGLGLVTSIFLEAAGRLEWLVDTSLTDIALIMVNGLVGLPLLLCLIPTLRHDRHPLRPGHALFIPFSRSPTCGCCLTTRTDGLLHGICSQLRPLPSFQPVSSPRPRPERETQIYHCLDEQVFSTLCLPWSRGLTSG